MTFSYTPFTTDRDRVRFHIGDTDAAAPIFTNAHLDALIVECGGWQGAVIAALEHLIALTSQPNFRADWLQVDQESARRGYEQLLRHKRRTFGAAGLVASSVRPVRVDE
ncbi:MAG: hypothetical protein SF162_17100 [bacterium]|nr:hypothetical protein [bacterium]